MSLSEQLSELDSAIEEKIVELIEQMGVIPFDEQGNKLSHDRMLDLRMFKIENGVPLDFRIEMLLDGYQVQYVDPSENKIYDSRGYSSTLTYLLEEHRDELVQAIDVLENTSPEDMPRSDRDVVIEKLTNAINEKSDKEDVTIEQVENWVGCDTDLSEIIDYISEVENDEPNALTPDDVLELWGE